MKKSAKILLFLTIISTSFAFTASTKTAESNELSSLSQLVKRLSPSVVNISTTNTTKFGMSPHKSPYGERGNDPFEEFFNRFFGDLPQREFKRRGLGSGFIISEDGYIITNNHVVEKADDVKVILENGESYKANVIGKDPKTDLALLKVEPKRKLDAVTLGTSSTLDIGDWVVAIGNPFGLGHTVTAGIISAKGRSLGLGAYDDFIQTDAAINPGNSGGPLFNLNGEVVGVNTAIIAGGQGIGFAIPVDMARNVVEQLQNKGKVVRGWLGVLVQQITPEIAESLNLSEPEGALVSDVTPGGPADKAGIKRGDVIVAFDGNKIGDMPDLPKNVAINKPGTESKITFIRNGKEKTVRLTLGELPEEMAVSTTVKNNKVETNLGIIVQEINPQIQRRFRIEDPKGVIITNVNPGTIGYEAGLMA
ncbi:MAG: Do family serine endopeptidase, partial [Deltaproteobacteria bacterium]|nr:Do family serine endopeptidase [Deltaproteobacteria bacterium]